MGGLAAEAVFLWWEARAVWIGLRKNRSRIFGQSTKTAKSCPGRSETEQRLQVGRTQEWASEAVWSQQLFFQRGR